MAELAAASGSGRQIGVVDQFIEDHGLGRVDVVGKQLGQHIGFRGDAALAELGRDALALVAEGQQLPVAPDGPLEIEAVRSEGGVERNAVTVAFDVGQGVKVEDDRAQWINNTLGRRGGIPPEPTCPPRLLLRCRHADRVAHITGIGPPPIGGSARPSSSNLAKCQL